MDSSRLEPAPFVEFRGTLKQYRSTRGGMTDYALIRAFPEFLMRDEGTWNLAKALWPQVEGSLLTHALGHRLRRLGANAVVYPSARADSFRISNEGVLKSFGGWKLVDYRNASPVEDVPWGTLFKTYLADIWVPVNGVDYKTFREAELGGSWAVTGNVKAQIMAYQEKSESLS